MRRDRRESFARRCGWRRRRASPCVGPLSAGRGRIARCRSTHHCRGTPRERIAPAGLRTAKAASPRSSSGRSCSSSSELLNASGDLRLLAGHQRCAAAPALHSCLTTLATGGASRYQPGGQQWARLQEMVIDLAHHGCQGPRMRLSSCMTVVAFPDDKARQGRWQSLPAFLAMVSEVAGRGARPC
jgi:hypothetical protein